MIRNWRQRATVQSAEYLSSLLGDRRCKLSFVFEHIPVLELFTVREPRKRLVSLKAVSGFSYSLYFLLLLFWAVECHDCHTAIEFDIVKSSILKKNRFGCLCIFILGRDY